jgi:hypothetical protein
MIRIAIFCVLILMLLYGINNRRRAPYVGMPIILITIVGSWLTAFPDTLQVAADWLGVGRGVDLMFYLFILVMLIMVINIHLRFRGQAETMTNLARALALATVRRPSGQSLLPK